MKPDEIDQLIWFFSPTKSTDGTLRNPTKYAKLSKENRIELNSYLFRKRLFTI